MQGIERVIRFNLIIFFFLGRIFTLFLAASVMTGEKAAFDFVVG